MSTLSHLRELSDALEDCERYQCVSLKQLNTDRDKKNMVLHAMLVSIQAAIDIVNHPRVQKCSSPRLLGSGPRRVLRSPAE